MLGNWRRLKCCFLGISTPQANDVEQCLMIKPGNLGNGEDNKVALWVVLHTRLMTWNNA